VTLHVSDSLPPSAQPSGTPRNLRWLWLTLGMVGVAAVAATAGALLAVSMASKPLAQRQLTATEAKAFNQAGIATGDLRVPALTRPVNILVLGTKVLSSDVANPPPGSQELSYDPTINSLEGLSDTMLLLRFDPATQRLVALSIPRDTRTWVEGGGTTKINEANATGGPASAARSVSELLGGVGIDRYVRINVHGVGKLIDALGGVTVYVPHDLHYQDNTQHLYINLKQGEQHLNGDTALQFLRFRYDEYGDIGRIQRQQMLMRSLMEQTLKPATVLKLPQFLSIIQSHLDTNLSVEELIALAGFASKIDRAKVEMLLLPGDFSTSSQFEASYWLPNPTKISTLMNQYFGLTAPDYAQLPASTSLKVALQDSTSQPEQAQKLRETLSGLGYGNVFIDDPWNQLLPKTQILVQSGDTASAEVIRKALGFGEVLTESTGNLDSDITIRLGQDATQAKPSPVADPASPSPAAATSPIPASPTPTASTNPSPASPSPAASTSPAAPAIGSPSPAAQPSPTQEALKPAEIDVN
jgi:polyisoprenyl-teichoic acid--peptidoglycan teichoic acid transferase